MPVVRPVLLALAAVALLAGCSAPAPVSTPPPSATAHAATPTPSATPSGAPLALVALGDSITRGTNACDDYGDCPDVSWSTGDDARVDSLADRLQASSGRPVTASNLAEAGDTVADLERQTAAAVAADPDVVTVLIGANDACASDVAAMTSTADYASDVSRAVARLLAGTSATVLLASVPDVTALVAAAGNDPTARFIWQRADVCQDALADPTSTTPDAVARRQAVQARIREYDDALVRSCAGSTRCVTDGGAVTDERPTLTQLSALDRFHPSVAGQRALAALEWRALEPRLPAD